MEFGWFVTEENYTEKTDMNEVMRGAIKLRNEDILRYSIEKGGDVNHQLMSENKPYWAPIAMAAYFGWLLGVKILMEHGAKIDILQNVDAPLCIAVEESETEIVNYFLEHGADPNIPTEDGEMPLHRWAVTNNTPEIAVLLLKHGSLLEGRDEDNYTPLLNAAAFGNFTGFKWLCEHGADLSAQAISEKNPEGKGVNDILHRPEWLGNRVQLTSEIAEIKKFLKEIKN